jgi:2-isopropylmalate synthase
VIAFYLKDRSISVFDTTLRDGEQSPGISLTRDGKLIIARQLDKLGVDVIEAGTPIVSKEELESIKLITSERLDAKICGLARVLREDIDVCLDVNVDIVHLFVSTSDLQITHTIKKRKEKIIKLAGDGIQYVKDHGLRAEFSAMDATRSDLKFLMEIYKAAEDAGADMINIPDTVGIMIPDAMRDLVSSIGNVVTVPMDVHCHNDFGLAVANSLAALEAGASQVQVTVNGIGERAGNASLAEVVMALHSIYGAKTNIKTECLVETAGLVARFTRTRILSNTPIVGKNAFSHESGIHAHGILADTRTFEPGIVTPEMVGHKRRIVLGKYAGKHSLRHKLDEIGLSVTPEQLEDILSRVKELGGKGKEITDADLYAIVEVVVDEVGKEKKVVSLEEFSVMTGNKVTPTAVVKVNVRGEERVEAKTGVGPVDAALKALQTIIKEFAAVSLHEFRIEAITGGSDALAEVAIGVEDEYGNIVTAHAASDDIVAASVEAFVNVINRILVRKGSTCS